MNPLKIGIKPAGDLDQIIQAIQTNCARNLPAFSPTPCKHDGTIVLVGSGPSVSFFVSEIKEHQKNGRPVFAVKGAHDFLMSHDITPDLWICLDPRDKRDGIQLKNNRTVYMLASRCDPVMFEHLADCNVMLWHSWSQDAEMPALNGKFCIGGGTTSGLRAINISYLMGFRNLVLYGYDSCLDTHNNLRVTGEKSETFLDVYVDHDQSRKFVCSTELAQQANEFQKVYEVMPDLNIEARGNGLIAAILSERKRRAA